MNPNPIQSVMIDTREPHWMQRLTFDGVLTAVTQLACGDVWVVAADGALLIVERKTAEDLLASIADGRLFDQAAAMVAMSSWAYIVVQGDLSVTRAGMTYAGGQETRWQWSAVQGALQTVQELGVAVVYLSDDEREFGRFLQRLAARSRAPLRAGAPRSAEVMAPGMTLLMSLPGIGAERAKTILEQVGSAAWALDILTSHADIPVAGIGNGTRDKIRAALGLPDGAKLQVVTE